MSLHETWRTAVSAVETHVIGIERQRRGFIKAQVGASRAKAMGA